MMKPSKLSLWYRQPGIADARLTKSNDTLPIGNGRLGAMVPGGIAFERIPLNEETLWSGGPGGREGQSNRGDRGEYSFGYNPPVPNREEIYQALKNGAPDYTMSTRGVDETQIQGNEGGYGNYKNFGFLALDYGLGEAEGQVQDYLRELDLETGLCRVSYMIKNTLYTREYMASYPDNAIAVHITARGGAGKVNLTVSLDPGQPSGRIMADNQMITVTGALDDNGLLYAGIAKVSTPDGEITLGEKEIYVQNASSAVVYFSAATDYKNEYTLPAGSILFEKLTYRTGEKADDITNRVAEALAPLTHAGFEAFRSRHISDYTALFKRVHFDLGGENTTPTDIALQECNAENMRMLEVLLYQYGRYLLIASSREGTLPANLQGVWNPLNHPPWASDYHTNINLQMNYWPAGGANLVELIEPLEKYLQSLMVTGRYTAQKYCYPASVAADAWKMPGAGWTTHASGGVYGFTAPGYQWYWGWAPAAGAWISQNLYQYLQYGGDKEIFIKDYWPIIREAAIFWTKALYKPTDGLWAGKYVVVPSFSPEHGPLTIAVASEMQLVWEIFTLSLHCIQQLELDDEILRETIEEKLASLYNPVNIGPVTGRVMEWTESENEFNSDGTHPGTAQGHRHLNHMVGFYPGTSIADGSQKNLDAAIKTLEWKGDAATGWSMGWKINLWARTGDGNHAHRLIENLLKINIAKNLFGLHALGGEYTDDGFYFQIDANFGYASGIQEMLLQSHLHSLDLLPAIPDAWESGSVKGLRAIGGHTVSMTWSGGALTAAQITAFSNGKITVRNPAFIKGKVSVNGIDTTPTKDTITIFTKANENYTILLKDDA